MSTVELYITGAGLLVELLVGSGLAKWILGLHTKVTMLEKDSAAFEKAQKEQTDKLDRIDKEVEVLKSGFDSIERHLQKLDLIGEMNAKIESMSYQLNHIMPREVIEAHFKTYDTSIEYLRNREDREQTAK